MKSSKKLLKMLAISMLVALGVVISPILRVEGMCPMAHFINIISAVLLGPWLSLLCAFLIAILRMSFYAVPPLALTGAVFGAFLSGVFYKMSKGRILLACIGEIIGTGIIGAIVSYPVMAFIMGKEGLTWLFYVPSFICGTLIGGSIAYIFLRKLSNSGALCHIQSLLGSKSFTDSVTPLSTSATIAAFGAIGYLVIKILTSIFKITSPVLDALSICSLIIFPICAIIYFIIAKKKEGGKSDCK